MAVWIGGWGPAALAAVVGYASIESVFATPNIDGYEVARRIRGTAWGGRTKLVALTGMGQKSDLEATRAAGFDEHLTKPADPEQLARIASGRVPNVVSLAGSGSG